MATKQFTPMLGKRIRVTELDECGAFGESSRFIATSGFITLSLTAEVEDGTEIIVRKADGSLCINEKQNDSFKYLGLEIQFCGVNPSLLAMVSNAEEYMDYDGDVAGFTLSEGEITTRFALEMWSGLSGQACSDGAESSGYMLLPHVAGGVVGDIEITGEDAVNFSVTSAITKGGNSWGVGPYDVMVDETEEPAPLPTALDPYDHFLMVMTTLAPPADNGEPQALTLP